MAHANMHSLPAERLRHLLDDYMARAPGAREEATLCLSGRRWDESSLLMVLDAAFTSVGLNYFRSVVPAVNSFHAGYGDDFTSLRDLKSADAEQFLHIWKNRRSWQVAREIATCLIEHQEKMGLEEEIQALASWAVLAHTESWNDNPVGRIKGVGLATFQYLRMMGGVDTTMPDKIVRRTILKIMQEADLEIKEMGDLALIETVCRLGQIAGYRSTEICWMCWLL